MPEKMYVAVDMDYHGLDKTRSFEERRGQGVGLRGTKATVERFIFDQKDPSLFCMPAADTQVPACAGCFHCLSEDERYVRALRKYADAGRVGVLPPCPHCCGPMEAWDAWLVTGAQCIACGWNYSEGSGCLA